MKLIRFLKTLLLLLPVLSLLACTRAGKGSITAEELRNHVEYLASDELAGRETGQAGIRKAESYIAATFREAGLAPLPGRSDYFIGFDLYRTGFDDDGTILEISWDGGQIVGQPGADFRPFSFSETGEREADVVFAGYGITASEYGYNDYDGLDVTGKFVLLLRHEPSSGPFGANGYTRYSYFRTKAENARNRGAAGIILFTDPYDRGAVDDLRLMEEVSLEPPVQQSEDAAAAARTPGFLAVHISQSMAGRVIRLLGMELEEVQRAVDGGKKPSGLMLKGVRAKIGVEKLRSYETLEARNVAGMIRGSDPVLRDEWVLVGGHHDHIGAFVGAGDTIYNGADDNASGISGVLELAQAFAALPIAPRRTLVFITFAGEEMGLFGSRAIVEQRQIPVQKLKYMLNLDMIGRSTGEPIHIYSGGIPQGAVSDLVTRVDSGLDLPIRFEGSPKEGYSDFYPFSQAGVPFLFLFTGYHKDYHQPGDHADKLDYPRMKSILRLAYGIVEQWAETRER